MFLGLIIVCGVQGVPTGGCLPLSSKAFYPDELACNESLLLGMVEIEPTLPPGAYFDDAMCLPIGETS